MTKNTTATETKTLSAEMIQTIKDAGGQNIYIMTLYSRSGMSRRMAFYMLYNGRLIDINHYIKPDLSPDRQFIRVTGYGCDMIALTLSDFYNRNGIPTDLAYRYHTINRD